MTSENKNAIGFKIPQKLDDVIKPLPGSNMDCLLALADYVPEDDHMGQYFIRQLKAALTLAPVDVDALKGKLYDVFFGGDYEDFPTALNIAYSVVDHLAAKGHLQTPVPGDEQRALELLALMYDKYENGVCVYEDTGDPDDVGNHMGNSFMLDADDESAIVELLNRRVPREANPPLDRKETE
jgi:hypothetical protein